jgi:hypothetical protein
VVLWPLLKVQPGFWILPSDQPEGWRTSVKLMQNLRIVPLGEMGQDLGSVQVEE